MSRVAEVGLLSTTRTSMPLQASSASDRREESIHCSPQYDGIITVNHGAGLTEWRAPPASASKEYALAFTNVFSRRHPERALNQCSATFSCFHEKWWGAYAQSAETPPGTHFVTVLCRRVDSPIGFARLRNHANSGAAGSADKNCHKLTSRAFLWRQKTTYLCHFNLPSLT
jgi:hypothetical protein